MAKVVKGANWALFSGTHEEVERFKELMEYPDPSAVYTKAFRRKIWDGKRKLYKVTSKGLLFRSGIAMWVAGRFYAEVQDVTPKCSTQVLEGLKLRDYQIDAVNAVKGCPIGAVAVPTGGGKTYIAAGIFKVFVAKKYLYIVHRAELVWQVYAFLSEVFPGEVGKVGGGCYEWDKKYVVAMIQTLDARLKKKSIDMSDVEVMIIDECHHSSARTYKKAIDACKDVKVRVGLTGTPPDMDTMSGVALSAVLGEIIYEIPAQELIDGGYIVGPHVKMYKQDSSELYEGIRQAIDWKNQDASKHYWDKIRAEALVGGEERNKKIAQLVEGKVGVLIVVDMIKHGKTLAAMVGCPFAWAGVEGRKELFESFRSGDIPIMVSSPILEEGVDIAGINVVVMGSGGKSRVKLLQRIGRGMRLGVDKTHVEVIDFWDYGIPLLERHARQRKKVYEKQGYSVEVVDA